MNAFNTTVRLLNQPIIKAGVKNIASSVTFTFGVVEMYDIYKISQGKSMTAEDCSCYPKWAQVAHKVVIVCAKISLVLSAGVSRPGVFIIASMAGCIFSTSQLDRAFGPNTIFAINPWHPRHIVSIVAVILALPSLVMTGYKAINQDTWLTDSKIRLMTLFNTVTSRPLLHLGNQLCRTM